MSTMDRKKILLLRSYSYLSDLNPDRKKSGNRSPPGLEALIPRTSTPGPDFGTYTEGEEWITSYGIFRHNVECPMQKVAVRGLVNPPGHFISGLLVPFENKSDISFPLEVDIEDKPKKWSIKDKLTYFRRKVRVFFSKYLFGEQRCVDFGCPFTCECQKMRSFLNKRICEDDVV